MPLLKLLRLSKPYANNNAGEIASFTPDTAAWIVKNQGGDVIGDFDPMKHVVVTDAETGVVSIADAEPELNADGKPTGNLVPKKAAPVAEKPPAKPPQK